MILEQAIAIATQLEGPYKWYAVGAVVLFLAVVVNRLVFKSFRWIFLLAGIGLIVLAFLWQFGYLSLPTI